MCVFFFFFFFLFSFFYSPADGETYSLFELTTLPRIFIRVVCRFNSVNCCFRSPTLAGAPFGSHCRYSVSYPYQWFSSVVIIVVVVYCSSSTDGKCFLSRGIRGSSLRRSSFHDFIYPIDEYVPASLCILRSSLYVVRATRERYTQDVAQRILTDVCLEIY